MSMSIDQGLNQPLISNRDQQMSSRQFADAMASSRQFAEGAPSAISQRAKDESGINGSLDFGDSGYNPVPAMAYKSENQVKLDTFLDMFKQQAKGDKCLRGEQRTSIADSENSDTEKQGKQDKNLLDIVGLSDKAPQDATGCSTIQTLKQYVKQVTNNMQNPRTEFFDLSRSYYIDKYAKDNKKTITVKSYLITEDNENFVIDLAMDIIQTNQGCMPIVKTFEKNAYNGKKFVKALKFYDYRKDCKRLSQFIVDEGVRNENFRTWDISLLHFGNSIIFYKREENWHKLMQYDVVKNTQVEIQGYQIEEPIGEEIRYNVMFSKQFGLSRKEQIQNNQKKLTLEEFLAEQYVVCQSYQIDNELNYINQPLVMWKLSDMPARGNNLQSAYHKMQQILPEAIQYIGHYNDKSNKRTKFVAIDPFCSHEFHYYQATSKQQDFIEFEYQTFHGNNELQILKIDQVCDDQIPSSQKHATLTPFLKHQHPQFLIQKQTVTIKKQQVEQFYYICNDSQIQLVFPNYSVKDLDGQISEELVDLKKDVIFQIAQKHSYNANPEDENYSYLDDFYKRQNDYQTATYKKISHVCHDDYRSKNHMKRSEHLRKIVGQQEPLTLSDKVILSTDQERSNIYVYKTHDMSLESGGDEHIEEFPMKTIDIYNYENNIDYSKPQRTLPMQIKEIFDEEEDLYLDDSTAYHSYYVNAKFNHVVASKTHVVTDLDDILQHDPHLTHRIENQDKKMFMIVEGQNGKYLNIRIKQDHNLTDMEFIMYNRNKKYYTFCFGLILKELKAPGVPYQEKKYTYFFVRKTIAEIEEMGADNHQSLIGMDQEVTIIVENDHVGTTKDVIAKYTKKLNFQDLIDSRENQQRTHIHLEFELCYDMKANIDFIPFIYQDKKSLETHNFLIFSVDDMEVVQKTCINSNIYIRKYLRKNRKQFSPYTITRTSEPFQQQAGFFTSSENAGQVVKYQISSQYNIQGESEIISKCTVELSEYIVKFYPDDISNIKLIGRKQLLLSDYAQNVRIDTFDRVMMIPFFDKKSIVKGSMLLLQEDEKTINMIDQDFNNLYHQQSEMIQFGHQKYLTNMDNHEEYILVVSCQFRKHVYMNGNFQNNESYFILNKIQKKLLSQQLAKFEYFVLNDDFDRLMREEFYQPQEVLQGKTICDICLNFPKEIGYGLRQKQEVYKSIEGSLAHEISQADEDLLNFYLEIGLCEENLVINVDFNFVTSIRLAMELNSNQSVKLLLTRTFDLNTSSYQEVMMLDLPNMLKQSKIERIYPFFERDHEELLQIQKDQERVHLGHEIKAQFCNFEEFLLHPNLPPFGSQKRQYHCMENFKDHHNSEMEIIEEIVSKDPYMTWGVENFDQKAKQVFANKDIEVEYSLVDFQKVIIGEKVRDVLENGFRGVNFNDQHLAGIMFIEDDEHLSFYNLETVRKIVDFQFIKTRQFLQFMFRFYTLGFVIPFLVSLSVENVLVLNIAYTLCFFTQIFFMIFEFIQLKEQRSEYFQDFWNLVDTSQFIIFVILYVIKMLSQFQTDSAMEMLLQGILLYQSFYKVFYFIRIYDSFCFIITMMTQVASEMVTFAIFATIMIFGFVKIYTLMHTGINDPNGEYDQINSDFIKRSIQTYKNTAGQHMAPSLDESMLERLENQPFSQNVIFSFICFMWASQQLFFGISGTFFIGTVLQSYEKHYSKYPTYHYKIKAKFNEEVFQIMDMFVKQRNFKVIFFAMDKKLKKEEDEMWLGVSNAFRVFMVNSDNDKSTKEREAVEQRNTMANNGAETLDLVNELVKDQAKQQKLVEDLKRQLQRQNAQGFDQQYA